MNTPTEIEGVFCEDSCVKGFQVLLLELYFSLHYLNSVSQICIKNVQSTTSTLMKSLLWFISLPLCTPLLSHPCIFSSVHPSVTSNYLLSSVNNLQVSALCQGMGKQNQENKTGKTVFPKNYYSGSQNSHVTEIRYFCKKSLADRLKNTTLIV